MVASSPEGANPVGDRWSPARSQSSGCPGSRHNRAEPPVVVAVAAWSREAEVGEEAAAGEVGGEAREKTGGYRRSLAVCVAHLVVGH